MHAWPAWGRWLAMATTGALLAAGFWLITLSGAARVLGLALLAAGIPLSVHVGRAARRERSRTVEHRYARQFMPAMLVYMVVMLYVWPMQKTMEPGLLKVAAALLPVVPIAWLIVASIRYVLGHDELERRQHLEALAIGVAIVSVASMVLGFLAAAKLIVVDASLALLLIYPALSITYGMTHCVLVWRGRAE
ncbi:hypothetical protein CA260_01565 [Dyella jiangningensis]|uniref:Transmembrane protein n=2 Tax=Dyella jiangningensis TaxID=1379159 RepID=A0A328P359_9GAMM|nr:hypothetical protein CA260_01565 [Dyella jiangningensis]